MSNNNEIGSYNEEDIKTFINDRSRILKSEREHFLYKTFDKSRKKYCMRVENQKLYTGMIFSDVDKKPKKIIIAGKNSKNTKNDRMVQKYMHLEQSYIKVEKNVIAIEGIHDDTIKKLLIEGRQIFPKKNGHEALVKIMQQVFDLSEDYIRKILSEPIEVSSRCGRKFINLTGVCSDTCYKIFKGEKCGISCITVAEETQIKLLLLSQDADYCDIAKKVNKTCNEVYSVSRSIMSLTSLTISQPPKKHKKKEVLASTYYQYKKRSEQYEGHSAFYKPCDHEGDCDDSCPCFKGKNFCEMFCTCSDKCKNRFRGCVCKGKCENKQCPCFAALRECQPGLCGCKPCSTNEGTCTNMRIQSNDRKKIVIKPSKIAGYGAFAGDDIKKGDFVVEYTGELITQEEAEKRGKLYDEKKASYLFDLTCDYAIDGMFIGNESRFLNHSESAPNCSVRTMTILGDKRIGLYAMRNIKTGEELLFNYRYNNEQKKIYFIKTK